MSARREKWIRRHARWRYQWELERWTVTKPPFWRIFRYRKWKKQKPDYDEIEKEIRKAIKEASHK